MSIGADLAGKKVLVSGAGTGIGRGVALTFAEYGADVVLHYSHSDAGAKSAAEEIQAMGRQARAIQADFNDVDAVCNLAVEAESFLGQIDVLVNNAGIAVVKAPQNLTDDDWDAVYETNLRGAWVLAQELIKRRLADGRECSIVNIASVLGLRGIGHVAPYAASKSGLMNV